MKELLEISTIIDSKGVYDYNDLMFNGPIILGLILLVLLAFIGGNIITKHINKDKKLISIILDFIIFISLGCIIFVSSIVCSMYLTDITKELNYIEYTISIDKMNLYKAEQIIEDNNIEILNQSNNYTYTIKVKN